METNRTGPFDEGVYAAGVAFNRIRADRRGPLFLSRERTHFQSGNESPRSIDRDSVHGEKAGAAPAGDELLLSACEGK